ncbi:Uncharacterised protein [Vibrio cholerae]|nr:Uncharacterised protein [Vibrio cholerae]
MRLQIALQQLAHRVNDACHVLNVFYGFVVRPWTLLLC